MRASRGSGLGNHPAVVLIGLIASLIGIFAFVSGKQNLGDFLPMGSPTTSVNQPKSNITPSPSTIANTLTSPTSPPMQLNNTSESPDVTAVKKRGKLLVGVRYDVPLFGFLSPTTNQPEGFDVDMARAVAERIFGSPDAIEFKEARSNDRIPYVEQGVVDVIFSTMTATQERTQYVNFSDCYFVVGQSLLVPMDSDISSIRDLQGGVVGTVKDSTSEQNIRRVAPQAQISLFNTYVDAVDAMRSRQVDAVTTDDIILYGFQKVYPNEVKIVGGQFTKEPYAAAVRKENEGLLEVVNATIREMKESGEWAELYEKWISNDVPSMPPLDWRDVRP